MEFPDYYEILQVTKASTDAEIKKAYRKLAMKFHPDKNPDTVEEAAKKFQEIGEAYDVLSDKKRRAIYDRFGYEGLRDGVAEGDTYPEGYSYSGNAQEIFEGFFGTSNPFAAFGFGESAPFASKLNKPGPQKGDTIIHNLDCTLGELYNGCVKKFNITRKRWDEKEMAPYEDTKQLVINVKKGWKKGTKVTFPNEGDDLGPNTIPADIVFVINEKPEPELPFVREGNNLVFTYRISIADALSDCSLQIPTLDKRIISIACPEVVSPLYEKKVESEGMPISKRPGEFGNLLIKFHILFPKYLSVEKKKKLRELLANEELLHN